jgi:tape measure domain-containing protein
MAKTVQAEMSTKIALDLVGATKSVNGLTSAVKASQSAWKAQEAMLKSSGDTLKAAQTRYEGLGKSIDSQQKKIELLKKRQSELQGNTKDTAKAYLAYKKDIDSATKQLSSLQSQQERAKSAMSYQESGLAKLQKGYKEMNTVSKSYVERLQAEGKTQEANQAKVNGYKSSISNLSKQLELQEKELERVASSTGKTSSEYAKQKTRVNETATSLAKAKGNMNELNEAMKKANPSPFNRIKTALSGVNEEAEKTHSIFKSVFAANIMSNVVSSAWSHLSGWISSATDSAKEYSLAQQTMNATWTTLTGNAKQGQAMVDMTNQMAIAANNATDMVDGLNQKFYSISKNVGTTKSLTQSVLTLQDAFGQSDDAVMNFSTQFSQMMANGKVSSQDMMSFVNVFPVLRTNLLKAEQAVTHNSKLTMAQMNDLMSAGKISSATMIKVVQDTAHEYGSATENFGKTIPGMIRTVKSQMPVLLSAITTPLTTAANPIIGTISGWVSSTKTKALFTKVGKTFADGLNNTIKAFSAGGGGNASSLTDKLNAGVEKLNSLISKTFAYLSAHAKDIKGIASDTWEIAKTLASGVWETFKGVLSTIGDLLGVTGKNGKKAADPLETIHSILNWMVEHKQGVKDFGEILAGLWMTSKVLSFASAIGKVYDGLTKITSGKLATGLKTTLGNFTSGKSFGGFGQSIKSAGGVKGLTTAGKVGNGLAVAGGAIDAGMSIYQGTQDKKGSTKQYEDYGTGIGTAIGTGIGTFFGGPLGAMIGAKIGGFIGKWGGDGAKKFMTGWDSIKGEKPDDFLGKIGYDAHKSVNGVTKWWRNLQKEDKKQQKQLAKQQAAQNKKSKKDWDNFWNGVGKGWTNFWSNYAKKEKKNQADAKKRQDAQNKAISKDMSNFWSSVTKGWSNFWSGIGKWATNGLNSLAKTITSKLNSIHKGWNSMWSSVGKFFSNIMNSINKAGSSALNWLASKFNSAVSGIRKGWNSMWSSIGKFFSNTLDSIKSVAGNALGWLGSKFSSGLSSISKGWSRAWNGMAKMFGGIWSGIKSAARTGLNGVIDIINGAIGGINWVWQKFTGHNAIKKIQKLASGGIVGKMQMVMVNDGAGEDYKELYRTPNGQYGMLQQRNAITMLPVGTRVYNGKETKGIMQMAGIQHYATGGIVGAVGNFFGAGWDKVTAIGDWLKHPIANMTKAVEGAVSGMTASTEMFTSLGKGVVSHMVSGVSAWAEKQLKKLEDTLSPAEPKGTGVQRWKPSVIKALKKNGFDATAGQVAAWLRVIARESNGNPKAINNWDSNAKAGHPSKGLVQTIDSTFNAYAFAGHHNIWNGYDNLLAGINYMKHIYGSGNSAFARVSGSEGYANGGFVNGAAYRLTGEAGPEMIMPLSQAKASRAWQLLGNAVAQINKNQNTPNVIDSDRTNTDLGAKLDNIANLLQNLAFAITVDLDGDAVAQKQAPKVKAIIDNSNRFDNYWKTI